MAQEKLDIGDPRSVQLRRLLVPDWLWQLVWLRHFPRYIRSASANNCSRSRWGVLMDLLYIFFKLRTVPEHYDLCRLWEVPKKDWVLYCGTPYTPITWGRLAKRVYPYAYTVLYNDKLAGARLCKSLSVKQPVIYGVVEPDASFHDRVKDVFRSSGQSRLMLKPIYGRSGIGIWMLEQTDAGIIARSAGGEIPLAEFRPEYAVFLQGVIRQDSRIAAIANSAVSTMRIVTMLTVHDEAIIIGCGMRLGVGKSVVDNWSAGSLAAGIDMEAGRLRKVAWDINGRQYTQHPDTHFTFEGFQIPEWPKILDTARAIQKELPFSRIAGMDLCLDDTATPVLIEINGLPDWTLPEQVNGPMLTNPQTLKAFAEYGLLTGPQKRLLAG